MPGKPSASILACGVGNHDLKGANRMRYNANILLILSLLLVQASFAANCEPPKLKAHIKDYAIVGHGDTATIALAPAFSGNDLHFAIKAKPKNPKNKMTFDAKKGVMTVQANKQDSFDVSVQVKNACGTASDKFNIEIDEET